MNRNPGLTLLALLAALFLMGGCTSQEAPADEGAAKAEREPLVPSRLLTGTPATGSPAPAGTFQGLVGETLDAGPYTYVRVEADGQSQWAAAPETQARVGDLVRFSTAMPMSDFESKTLGRTFDLVYFTQAIERVGASANPTPSRPSAQTQPAAEGLDHGRTAAGAAGIDLEGIEVAEGGLTVAAAHERSAELAGQEVVLRGRVVKFTAGVMNHNWLHLQDGSGEGETADLTVITDGEAAIGDLVTVRGEVAVDQNFGFGYEYPVLVKDALVTIE